MRWKNYASFYCFSAVVACHSILQASISGVVAVDTSFKVHGDVCTLNEHCMNAGKCVSASEEMGYRHCVCKEGFSGPRCSRYCPLNCENGGYCTVKPRGGALGADEQTPTYVESGYMCKCFGHFTGRSCETPYINCGDRKKCFNGGECKSKDDLDFSADQPCRCQPSYQGPSCETEKIPFEEIIETENVKVEKGGKWTLSILSVCVLVMVLLCWRCRRHNHMSLSQDECGENIDAIVDEFVLDPRINTSAGIRRVRTGMDAANTDRGELELHLT
jgi:hypothetical protein